VTSHDLQLTNLCCAMLSLLRVGSFVLSIFSSSLLSENIKIQMYKSVILPVVLYECETLSLTWRKVIGWRHSRTGSCGKFYPKREKVKGGWRKIQSEQLCFMYSSNIIRQSDQEEEMGRLCTGLKRNVYRVSVRKPEGRTLIGGHMHTWEDNLKICVK